MAISSVAKKPPTPTPKPPPPKPAPAKASTPPAPPPPPPPRPAASPKPLDAATETGSGKSTNSTDSTSLVAEARDSRGRADLLKQTNADLKILDAEYKKIDGKINAKTGDYLNANTELKNQLDTIKRGDAASWVSTADMLGKTLDGAQNGKLLNADALVADRKRLETENLDPILKRIEDAGYKPAEFLKESDVYKLTSNSTSARDLSAAAQALGSTASDLTNSLTKLWDDPATGISKDEGAIAAAGRLGPVLKDKAADNNLAATYSAAGSLGNVVENAGGDSIASDPKWATVRAEQGKFFDDVKNVYRPDPPGSTTPAPVEPTPEKKFSEEDIRYMKQTLAVRNQLVNTLASNYDSQAGDFDAQDFPQVESASKEHQFAKRAEDFLKEIESDKKLFDKRFEQNRDLNADLQKRIEILDHMAADHGWTLKDMEEHAPDHVAVFDVAWENLSDNAARLADSIKVYHNKLDGKAAEFIQAWDRTRHTEKSQAIADTITSVIDVATGLGIGGNAITQFAMKEFKEVKNTFDRFSNAYYLRGGQVGDMAQAFWNTGNTLKNYYSKSTQGIQDEAQGNVDSADKHLVALVDRFNDYVDEYNRDPGDPNPFVPI